MISHPFANDLKSIDRWARLTVGAPWLILKSVSGFLLSGSILIPCGFLYLTGYECPLCGATHAANALANGQFITAWKLNSGVVFLFGVAAIQSTYWLIESLTGRRINLDYQMKILWKLALIFLFAAWIFKIISA